MIGPSNVKKLGEVPTIPETKTASCCCPTPPSGVHATEVEELQDVVEQSDDPRLAVVVDWSVPKFSPSTVTSDLPVWAALGTARPVIAGASNVNLPVDAVPALFATVSAIAEFQGDAAVGGAPSAVSVHCEPAGDAQESAVWDVQKDVMQTVSPICKDAVASKKPKFSPAKVSGAPPVVGPFADVANETVGGSKVNTALLVPVSAPTNTATGAAAP